jgi:hypothetical protein
VSLDALGGVSSGACSGPLRPCQPTAFIFRVSLPPAMFVVCVSGFVHGTPDRPHPLIRECAIYGLQ